MNDNQKRSNRFDAAVDSHGDDSLIDMLTDAMHWADHTGRDFHIALAHACRHYIHELNDEQLDERRMIP